MPPRPKPAPLPQHPFRGSELRIPLREILGLDPCNSRVDAPDAAGIEQLARDMASHGQLAPVLVRGMPGQGYRVLAGGRRWRALCWLDDHGEPQPTISVCMFSGDDVSARAFSLAENVNREDLHPLAQAEQFAALAAAEPRSAITRAFGERHVAQQLALAALPDAAKRAWREGLFGLPCARALASGEPEAIVRLIEHEPDLLDDPRAIREALKPKGVSSKHRDALFVGLDAFAKAGGEVITDLFDDQIWLADVDLLRRLVNQKLSAEGQRICDEEGWGTLYLEAPVDFEQINFDYTAAEEEELLATEKRGFLDGEAATRLDEMDRIAALRTVPMDLRGSYGVHVWVDGNGKLAVDRGYPPFAGRHPQTPPGAASSPVTAPPAGGEVFLEEGSRQSAVGSKQETEAERGTTACCPAGEAGALPTAPPEDFAALSAAATRQRAARLPLDATLNAPAAERALIAAGRAVASRVARDDRAARMMFVAAALQNTMTAVQIRRLQGAYGATDAQLRSLSKLPLLTALGALDGFGDADLGHVFRLAVASSISLRPDPKEAVAFFGFAKTLFDDLDAAFAEQVDYAALFRDGGEPLARAAIRDCVGDAGLAERAHLRGPELIADAAMLARAKRWLPEMWRGG